MIASLRGTIIAKDLQHVVVDVAGVGYRVSVSAQTLAELPDQGNSVFLLCYTHVREDQLQLFGFLSAIEQKTFEQLISISGVGPKLAMTILSGMAANQVQQAISEGDLAKLTSIPGVGRKTAERLVVELRDKMTKLVMTDPAQPATTPAVYEVIEALVNLGYKRAQAERATKEAASNKEELGSSEKILRKALTIIGEMR